MAQRALTVLSGLAKGKVFPLSAENVSVGRDDAGTIVFDDNDISREHALLTLEGQDYRLKDLQSRNGTRVNGQLIKEKLLVPGDRIQFGLVEVRYEATRPVVPKPAPAVQVVVPPVRLSPPPARPAPVPPPAPKPVVAPAPPVAAPVVVTPAPAADDQRLRAELSAKAKELEEAKRKLAQADEISRQNQQLAAQVATLQQQTATIGDLQKKAAELAGAQAELQRLKAAEGQTTILRQQLAQAQQQAAQLSTVTGELQKKAAELATAQTELQRIKEQATRVDELTGKLTTAQQQLAAVQQELTIAKQQTMALQQAEAEIATLRTELAATRAQAGRVAELTRSNEELSTRASMQQQVAGQAEARVQESITAQAALRGRLEDVERKNRELTGLVTGAQAREKEIVERAQAEQNRTAKRFSDIQAELEDAKRRLAQSEQLQQQNQILATQLAASRVELSGARQQLAERPVSAPPGKPVVEQPIVATPVRPTPVPPATNVIAAERAAEHGRVQAALNDARAQLEKLGTAAAGGRELTERLETVRTRLAETETADDKKALGALRRLREDVAGVRADLFGLSSPVAPAAGAPAVKSSGRRRGFTGRLWAVAGAVGVVIVAVVLAVWQGTGAKPAAETKAPASATASVTPVAAEDPAAVVYTDPKGRFTCRVPSGWTTQEIPDEVRSRVKFVSGNDEIRVNSYGADWPDLRMVEADQKDAMDAIGGMLKLDNREDNSYAQVMGPGSWRRLEGVWAYQSEMKLAVSSATWHLQAVYYRKLGREHIIDMCIRSLDQQQYLQLAMERFLGGFQSVAAKKQTAQLVATP